ncbi:phosphate starvation-inducible protein PhoH [Tissierella praeacuta DSM 18095]|uniref:PhoH-like protein n=1 Tax=Tissierella praeacuta DSM 18095 TaxID=1123404 RepID=A0A1M4S8V0_9FIRM|nr:PhoH family protein [Tissierella praeacuta]SHE28630.1 phosphate starvation-inducible protein PhoH [Tissierella praeacuta DSM 18095]SUP01130.1 PhoH-like protein [Tissierella praeacuta]
MPNNIEENSIIIENHEIIREIFGELDENINIIKEELGINIAIRDDKIKLYGNKVSIDLGEKLIYNLIDIVKEQGKLDEHNLRYSIKLLLEGQKEYVKELLKEVICVTSSGKSIKPKTLGQKRYLDSIRKNDIVFGIGPAGTGKTYLAMAMAVQSFKNKEVNRIILTRPAVEAGESLGFLPGDLQEKVDPYLRPIYDALFDILGAESYAKYMEKGLIEVAPLAYMRGRTLDSSYVILDEAQNTTNEQMKMFLTRLGFGSKAIITGDITQIDLSKGKESGLKTISNILKDVNGIDFIYLSKNDIVRHPLVQRIIEAYDKYENTNI